MSTRMPSFHISNSDDLDTILNVCRRELEDNMSVTSISSTSTASDLPGPGRTLGRLYSFLGVRLETQLGRLAERFGYSPNAIEQRVLARSSDLPPQGSNGQNKLKKDLKRLIGYTQSVIHSNRIVACSVVTSVALLHPYYRDMLVEVGAARALGIACLLEEASELGNGLLSPSRKALICVVTTELHSIGSRWLLLVHQFRDLGRSCMSEDGRMTGSLNVGEHFYDTHTSCYKSLVKYVGEGSPEESWLGLRYFTGHMRHRVHHGLGAAIDKPAKAPFDKYRMRPLFQKQLERNRKLHMAMAESVRSTVSRAPQSVDWSLIEFALLQLLVQDFVMAKSGTPTRKCTCTQIVDAIFSEHSAKISPEMAGRISAMRNLRQDQGRTGNPFMAIEGVLSGKINLASANKG